MNAAYQQADVDRLMLERSLELSSDELSHANSDLHKAILELQMAHSQMERRVVERTQELNAATSQLLQAQKMEAIGQLAGGVAHDFNNLLTVILGYCELILHGVGPNDPLREDLEEIHKAGTNAVALTRQLLAFSRKQIIEPRVLDLNAVIVETTRMLQRLVGENIEVEIHLAPGLGRVRADPGQVNQVLVNLVVNARDAMPDGGKVTIETDNAHLDQSYADMHVSVIPGPYVALAVSDTGTGITPEVQARLFEPFFTTKEQGKGTGLGLASVYGIVKQNEGNIWLYSEIGHGTTFKIFLPRVAADADALPAAGPLKTAALTGTILVVEDNDGLRALTSKILRGHGYLVLAANNATEALRICGAHPGPIALLLTDVVMPGLSGPSLAAQLTADRGETRVLYMSGYASDAIVRHGVLDGSVAFLPKPFSADALARKVQEVLAEPTRKA